MRTWRTLLVTALIGLFLSTLFVVSPARAQEGIPCDWASPIVGGEANGDFGFLEKTPWEAAHTGEDYIYPAGTPVVAVDAGIVEWAGWWPPEGQAAGTGFGPVVWIRHSCGAYSFYAHLDPIDVIIGQEVARGQQIASVGPLGITPAENIAHLHLGKWFPTSGGTPTLGYAWRGQWYDPLVNMATLEPEKQVSVTAETPQAPVKSHWSREAWMAVYGIIALLSIIVFVATGAARWAVQEVVHYFFWSQPGQWSAWRAGISGAILCTLLYMVGKITLQVLEWHITPSRVVAIELVSGEDEATGISPIFAPEVQAWGSKIVQWSGSDLDPNLVATIIQIESCGQQFAVSRSGAQGLFQVMPFHFAVGDDMLDPDTNADRGTAYLRQTKRAYPDDVNRAIAAYNGGIAGVSGDYSSWAKETQRYHYYGSGIYADASSGVESSERLEEWLAADGGRLCKSTLER